MTNIPVLLLDPDILVVDKPAGLLSIQDGYHPELPHLRTILEPEFGRLWMVHRLDKDTSGVVILARNEECHRALNQAFQDRQVHKTYLALVDGVFPDDQTLIDAPLKVDADRKHRTRVDIVNGKPAQTEVEVMQVGDGFTSVFARPRTGYTHQIRAHLASTGHPLICDFLYGYRGELLLPRVALHALRIQFTHPRSNIPLQIEAAIPTDFQTILRK